MSFSTHFPAVSKNEARPADSPVSRLHLHNAFVALGPAFYTPLPPTPLPAPYCVAVSPDAATLIGLEIGSPPSRDFVEIFAGNAPLPGGMPLASVYSGHQFGVWAGQLGDGRAHLLGEAEGPCGSYEIQLKGSGRTPYSRMGDGRAVLRSSIREFLCSEAMAALGIPTTRALCVIGSEAPIRREVMETAAVVTRLAPTFVRFGHFEHFAAQERLGELQALCDFIIARFYPHCRDAANPPLALLGEVVARTAELIAAWQAVGFCHGVMNTDNMSILGLTLDYGPFGFFDAFDAGHVCNHSDHHGRYAYDRQPAVASWNLACLAQALLPLIAQQQTGEPLDQARVQQAAERAIEILNGYATLYAQAHARRFRAKLGLRHADDGDQALLERLLAILQAGRVDYTIFFRKLAALRCAEPANGSGHHDDAPLRDLFINRGAFDAWARQYRIRLRAENSDDAARRASMLAVNPKYVLRNHLAELAIRAATDKDFSEVQRLHALLQHPFDEQPQMEAYAAPPPDWANRLEISCSS